MSDENIIAPNTSDYKLNPELSFFDTKIRVEFNGSCLKQDEITYDHGKVVNIYIVYEISSDYLTLENCLFVAVSLTKNADVDQYKYYGYGIGFDRHEFFLHPSSGTGRNVTIFGVDMSLSTKIDKRKKYILVLGKGLSRGLEHTLTAEKSIQLISQGIIKSFI